jgi:amino acid permease
LEGTGIDLRLRVMDYVLEKAFNLRITALEEELTSEILDARTSLSIALKRPCEILVGSFFLPVAKSSHFGISMAMSGALRDIFSDKKYMKQSVELLILLPLFIAMVKPRLFFIVLGLAGGIFGNLIAGILPVTAFLKNGRFRFRYLLLWIIFIAIFVLECANLLRC